MFEQEILQQLKTRYKNLGLSETILKAKAKQLSKAVEKQEDIENAVAGVEDDLAIFQSFADQNRTLAKKIEDLEKGKGADPKPEPTPKPETGTPNPNPAPTGDVPEWAKALIESNKTLTESLTKIQEKEAKQTTAQTLQARFTELKIPQSFQKLIPMDKVFATPEEMEAFVTEQKANYDAVAQEFGNAALAGAPKPLFGEAKKEGEVSLDVQAYLDAKKPAKTNE
ncbi:hypothetical protein [Chryseobacterium indologenes]|uniref:Uncharacterized protein n=1 Tax=Chryseobacterium indologenes TaxID=253 RepID=A0A0N0IWB9_CHRID|nr:hypothetical protein [Chryseobacterium indologenes]KPE51261.1 hypothetical protein AOB46_11400 [Chryseobacterium indologenes]